MPIFQIETETDGREVYTVEAASKEEVRERFNRGDVGPPDVSEVTGASIEHITEVDEYGKPL